MQDPLQLPMNPPLHRASITSTRSERRDSFMSTSSSASIISNSALEMSYSRQGTSWFGGIMIMANVCIGMGLLNYPRAIAQAGGLLPFSLIFIVFVLLIMISLGMTAYCCRYYGSVNYQDMVTTNCGNVIGLLCQMCLLLETLGNCVVKLVVFADQLDRVIGIIHGSNAFSQYWYFSRSFTLPMVASLTVLPFCLMRDFQIFKYTSILGIIGAFYISFGVALGRYITGVEMPTHVT